MTHDDDVPSRERWARFRFAIVGPLLAAPPERGQLRQELERLARPAFALRDKALRPGRELTYARVGKALKIFARFRCRDADEFGIRVCRGDGEQTVVGYNTAKETVFVDRTQSGKVDFHPNFAGRHTGPLPAEEGVVTLLIFVDTSSVEVFGNDGHTVLTERVFPAADSQGIQVYANGGTTILEDLQVWKIERAMP